MRENYPRHIFAKTSFLILALWGQMTFSQATLLGEQRLWHTQTILFNGPDTSEEDSNNPFLNYRLNVTFTAPSGHSFIVPGFYAADGDAAETSATSGNKWAVHFTPNEVGMWNFKVSFRTGEEVAVSLEPNSGAPTSFDGIAGSFVISENNKALPDNRAKGRLSYSGERYLKFEGSDKHFIKVGADSPENLLAHKDFDNAVTTKEWEPHIPDWNTGDPVWKGNKGKGLFGAINYLAAKGMNAFSFNMFNLDDPNTNNGGGQKTIWPWSSTDIGLLEGSNPASIDSRMRYDVSKLEQWEILFSHGDKKGMFMHFKTQERGNMKLLDGGNLGVQRMLYYREIIARFGHHLALNWNLGEEFHIYDPNVINSLAAYIKALDPYDHLIVLHSFPGQQENLYSPVLGSSSGLTGVSLQIDIDMVHNEVKKWNTESKNNGQQWVVSNDEQGHWRIGVTVDEDYDGTHGIQPDNRDDVRHKILWGTLMAGGFGVEYYFGTETGETDWASENWRSRETKWEDAKIALDFFNTYIDFWEMESNDELTDNTEDYCFADVGNTYVIYLPEGGTTDLYLSNSEDTYLVSWYDPRRGDGLHTGSLKDISGEGYQNIGYPPYEPNLDWVVFIKEKTDMSAQLSGLSISPKSIYLEEGQDVFFEVESIPGIALLPEVTWSSNNTTVATVDSVGHLNALSEGVATIVVKTEDGNFKATAQVSVQAAPKPNSITYFTLVNAETEIDLFQLTDGLVIESNTIEDLEVNIRASTNPSVVVSVSMSLSGPVVKQTTENIAPYTLFGNDVGNYFGKVLTEGNYVLSATPYSEHNLGGAQGTTKSISFSIKNSVAINVPPIAIIHTTALQGTAPFEVRFDGSSSSDDKGVHSYLWDFGDGNSATAAEATHTFSAPGNFNVTLTVTDAEGLSHSISVVVTSAEPVVLESPDFTLVNAVSDTDLFKLEDNMVINSETVLNKQVNIRANLTSENTESVAFQLKGPIDRVWTENVAPYALFGDILGDYQGKELPLGRYTLNATAYSGNQLTGTQLSSIFVAFTITDPESKKNGIIMHPNPAVGYFHAEMINPSDKITEIFIYDIAGGLVYNYSETQQMRIGDGKYKIDTSSLTSGVYLVKVYTNSFDSFHYKLMIKTE